MNKINTLETLRQCFNFIPKTDARTGISPLEFVINLIFWNEGDTECVSLEGIRRYMKSQTQTDTASIRFWERLSRERLKKFLTKAVSKLLMQLGTSIICAGELLKQLGVTGVYLIDSCTFTLWDGATKEISQKNI
jgi:hypothetical protein